MKQFGIILLLIFNLSLFFSCDIDSPYVDAVSLKIDSDNTPADQNPQDDPPPITGGVAVVTNFMATALSYDPDTDSGIIRLSWDAPVASGDQTEATRIVVREYEAVDPTGITSGNEVFDGAISVNQADFTGVALSESPHFGIWTLDADDNISAGQFDNTYIRSVTVTALYDAYAYVDLYSIEGSFDSTALEIRESQGEPSYAFVRFDPIAVNNILVAYMGLRVAAEGNIENLEIDRITQDWGTGTSYFALRNLSSTALGSFAKGTAGNYTQWDVTSTVQGWTDTNDYGFRLYDQQMAWNPLTYYSDDSSSKPKLEIYYGTD